MTAASWPHPLTATPGQRLADLILNLSVSRTVSQPYVYSYPFCNLSLPLYYRKTYRYCYGYLHLKPILTLTLPLDRFATAYEQDGKPLVENIMDKAGQKGTGKWTAIDALNLGMPLTLIGESGEPRPCPAMSMVAATSHSHPRCLCLQIWY